MQTQRKYLVGGIILATGLSVLIAGAVLGSPLLIGGAAAFLVLCIGCAVTAKRRTHPSLV